MEDQHPRHEMQYQGSCSIQKRRSPMAMPRAKATAAANGEVWVEKVDRIRFVYNAIIKPSVYVNPRAPR